MNSHLPSLLQIRSAEPRISAAQADYKAGFPFFYRTWRAFRYSGKPGKQKPGGFCFPNIYALSLDSYQKLSRQFADFREAIRYVFETK
jgi:hypothetical protein